MGKAVREQLSRVLNDHLNTIHETLQILDKTPPSSLDKVSWKEVIQMGEQISKQATNAGMLYTGENPGVEALEENMAAYFNMLQGFLLLSHGSSTGAGPTLSSCIHKAVKQVVDSSFMLLHEAVSSYGSPSNKTQKLSIPQLAGAVWEACSALKKTPSTNVIAIGKAISQVAVSMKDVLREMNELKPASNEEEEKEPSENFSTKPEDKPCDEDDDLCDGDLGSDLSPEEMKIVELTTDIVSRTLVFHKELIRCITLLLQRENSDDISVDSLEKILKVSQRIGVQVDELGACLYPPQEISAIKVAIEKISSLSSEVETELRNLKGCTEDFGEACSGLRSSLRKLGSELGCDLVPQLENLVITD
ncbi:hypothetical protein ABFS83_12G071000 [Erythranthe nasuta]